MACRPSGAADRRQLTIQWHLEEVYRREKAATPQVFLATAQKME